MGLCTGVPVFWGIHTWWKQVNTVQSEGFEQEEAGLVVDYPFSREEEGWSLLLKESRVEDAPKGFPDERTFCLYDEDGQLLQEFRCGIAADELVFRYDKLFYYYGYDKDLIVYPAGAQETGAEGLLYAWNMENRKFVEEPVFIPWYEEGAAKEERTFVVSVTEGSEETDIICCIDAGSRKIIELRRWTLHKDTETGEESLCIYDCLERQNIWSGEVERNELGGLLHEKYYQYLLWDDLEHYFGWTGNREIETEKVTGNHMEIVVYADKEALLADCGFTQEEPLYEYYDGFHNLLMELYFDPQTGQGCGICYRYHYNDNLEKVVSCHGFTFDEVETRVWEPEDAFSTLSVRGRDARADNVSGYRETYEYTDEGRLSFFEARGTVVDYGEDGPWEDTLLSMDYIYRNDGTLCHKEYHHHHILFGTTFQSQFSDYDELGRLVYRYGYITHGSLEYYYIYEESDMEPAYCLEFDHNGGLPVLVIYS